MGAGEANSEVQVPQKVCFFQVYNLFTDCFSRPSNGQDYGSSQVQVF